MRPGTPHFVVTVEDCMAIGGHFYSKENFLATLQAIALEHCMGVSITNTEHPTAPLILFKLMNEYSEILKFYTDLEEGQLFHLYFAALSHSMYFILSRFGSIRLQSCSASCNCRILRSTGTRARRICREKLASN